MKRAADTIRGHRRPNTFASWPYMGIREVLHKFEAAASLSREAGGGREAYMVKKYALETQM
ncbi:hypothetical protein LTR28_013357 [Elasticomyces elasticus]|nr:hypothetical protein LTR28_013357 [Elasticomyces elasticus]